MILIYFSPAKHNIRVVEKLLPFKEYLYFYVKFLFIVIPVKTGIFFLYGLFFAEIPACAGMTLVVFLVLESRGLKANHLAFKTYRVSLIFLRRLFWLKDELFSMVRVVRWVLEFGVFQQSVLSITEKPTKESPSFIGGGLF